MYQNDVKSIIRRNESQSFDSNWISLNPINQLSKQSDINSGRLTCRYKNNRKKNNKQIVNLYSSMVKEKPDISCKFTNQLIHMSNINSKRNRDKKCHPFSKLRVNKSQCLEYLAFQMKINRNISAENHKILQFTNILLRKTNKSKRCTQPSNMYKNKQQGNKNEQQGNKNEQQGNKNEELKYPSQKMYKYKSATSSPFIIRQKQKKQMIKMFQKQQKQRSNHNILKNIKNIKNIKNKVDRTVSKNDNNFLQVCGQKPKWKQFQSWRRMRYKITVLGNQNKVKKLKKKINYQNL